MSSPLPLHRIAIRQPYAFAQPICGNLTLKFKSYWTKPRFSNTKRFFGLLNNSWLCEYNEASLLGQVKLDWVSLDSFYKDDVISATASIDVPFRYRAFVISITNVHVNLTRFRANSISWCGQKSDSHTMGICVAGSDSGSVIFFDPKKLISGIVFLSFRMLGKEYKICWQNRNWMFCYNERTIRVMYFPRIFHVMRGESWDCAPTFWSKKYWRWAMTGGGNGQLLLWDLSQLGQPFSPGQPSFADQVWN